MKTLALIGFLFVVLFVAGSIVLTLIALGGSDVRASEPDIEDDEARLAEAKRRRLQAAMTARAQIHAVDANDDAGIRSAMLDMERLR